MFVVVVCKPILPTSSFYIINYTRICGSSCQVKQLLQVHAGEVLAHVELGFCEMLSVLWKDGTLYIECGDVNLIC